MFTNSGDDKIATAIVVHKARHMREGLAVVTEGPVYLQDTIAFSSRMVVAHRPMAVVRVR